MNTRTIGIREKGKKGVLRMTDIPPEWTIEMIQQSVKEQIPSAHPILVRIDCHKEPIEQELA